MWYIVVAIIVGVKAIVLAVLLRIKNKKHFAKIVEEKKASLNQHQLKE